MLMFVGAQTAIYNFVGRHDACRRWRFRVMHDRDHCIERIFGVLQRILGEGPLLLRPENASGTQCSIPNAGRTTSAFPCAATTRWCTSTNTCATAASWFSY